MTARRESPARRRAGAVQIPHDEEAEWLLVALATGHPADARAVKAEVAPDDFYRPALATALLAAFELETIQDEERRVAAVAQVSGLRRSELAQYVDDRVGPVRRWARKVRCAALRRRAMGLAAELYNGATDGSSDQLLALAHALIAELQAVAAETELRPVWDAALQGGERSLGFYLQQRDTVP